MKNTLRYLLIVWSIALATPLYADKSYYDQQEEIRRGAERLVEHDRQQKEAAARRYDEKYRSSSSPTLLGRLVGWGIMGGMLLLVLYMLSPLLGHAIDGIDFIFELFERKKKNDPSSVSTQDYTNMSDKESSERQRAAWKAAHRAQRIEDRQVQPEVAKPRGGGFSAGSAVGRNKN